jgi:predicted AlkP superfamily pyrophosphatase or phosphodiesterase
MRQLRSPAPDHSQPRRPRALLALALNLLAAPLLLTACETAPHAVQTQAAQQPVPVILVSLDGFRADYIQRGLTPNLARLARTGVTTTGMHPSFPSITFPNHYTLVTGDRPDRHGIVGNTMTDPAMPGVTFRMSAKNVTANARWWDEATPIWVTAERHGLRTATMFWPGSDVAIDDVRPTDWLPYDNDMTSDDRTEKLLSWFDVSPDQRPRFATLYLNAVDSAGHEGGPDSPDVRAALAEVDEAVGRLIAGLQARHITANVVIVADHGMAAVGAGQSIALSDLMPKRDVTLVTGGAYAGIDPRAGADAVVARALLGRHAHMQCWRKADVPARFAYGRNPRVPAFVCLADVGWTIDADHTVPHHPHKGTHGYDPMAPEMQALFIAHGPAFDGGRMIAPFDNVDVYPLLMHLLGLPPEPDDGTIAPFTPVLTPETHP